MPVMRLSFSSAYLDKNVIIFSDLSILNDQIKAHKSTSSPDMIIKRCRTNVYTKTATGKPDQKGTIRFKEIMLIIS